MDSILHSTFALAAIMAVIPGTVSQDCESEVTNQDYDPHTVPGPWYCSSSYGDSAGAAAGQGVSEVCDLCPPKFTTRCEQEVTFHSASGNGPRVKSIYDTSTNMWCSRLIAYPVDLTYDSTCNACP